MSMFNDIDWTKRGIPERCIPNSEQVKKNAETFSQRLWTFLGPGDEKKWYGTQLHTWRKKGFHRLTDGGTIQRNRSPNIQEHQCFESWNSEKKRWQRYHTLQCGFIENRALVSHNSLSKFALYQLSSLKLVWRVRSKDSESKRVDLGKIRGKRKRATTEKCEAARSEFFGANSKGVIIGHLETDCQNVFRDLKHWRTTSNLRKFVKMRHSA